MDYYGTSFWSPTDLTHYGVLGMKWGIRRYQNKDGSLKPAGKKRYITVRDGLQNARTAGQEAWRKSVSDNGGKLVGKSKSIAVYKNPADKFRGRKAANDAYNNAYRESLKNDKARNRQLKSERNSMSEDARVASSLKKKSVKSMSNSELKKLNERVRLEQEYSRLNPSVIKKGLAIAGGVAAGLGTVVAIHNNGKQAIDIGKKVVAALANKP